MLLQEIKNNDRTAIEKAIEVISEKCAPFLHQTHRGQMMYRGSTNKFTEPYQIKQTRVGRRPFSTPMKVHQWIDDWFHKNFNMKARSNAVFASGSYNRAAEYGDVYAFFPVDGFDFVWSPKVDDLYEWLVSSAMENPAVKDLARENNVSHNFSAAFELATTKLEGTIKDIVYSVLENADFQTTNLPGAIKSGNEIMFSTYEYVLVPNFIWETQLFEDRYSQLY